jgi:hypothetical protein
MFEPLRDLGVSLGNGNYNSNGSVDGWAAIIPFGTAVILGMVISAIFGIRGLRANGTKTHAKNLIHC